MAVDHSVQPTQVLRPVHGGTGIAPSALGDHALDAGLTVFRLRVGREPSGHTWPAGGLRDPPQHAEHAGHFPGVVAHARHIPEAQHVGLSLVVPAEPEEEQSEARLRDPSEIREVGRQQDPDTESELGQLLLADLAR